MLIKFHTFKGIADLGKNSFSGLVGRKVRLSGEGMNWK